MIGLCSVECVGALKVWYDCVVEMSCNFLIDDLFSS